MKLLRKLDKYLYDRFVFTWFGECHVEYSIMTQLYIEIKFEYSFNHNSQYFKHYANY